jgi:hypothetical protein
MYQQLADDASRLLIGDSPVTAGENVFPFRAQWISPTAFIYTADGKIKKRAIGGARAEVIPFHRRTPDSPFRVTASRSRRRRSNISRGCFNSGFV